MDIKIRDHNTIINIKNQISTKILFKLLIISITNNIAILNNFHFNHIQQLINQFILNNRFHNFVFKDILINNITFYCQEIKLRNLMINLK